MDIAGRYAALATERATARRMFTAIALDHGRAARAIRAILDLPEDASTVAHQPTLARSIELRNPYVDPLSFIQVELLRRARSAPSQGEPGVERAVLLSINGIAGGLRNTG
jgi:phosphoenolpyruvate carboxylase